MKWSLDIHKYPSEKTRSILKIMRDLRITKSSSAEEISKAEDLMDTQGLYSGKKGAEGRIRRALFTYFAAYYCVDESGELTEFGKLFTQDKITIKEYAFHYIANYSVGGGSDHHYFPLHMLLLFSKKLASIAPEQNYITATDFKNLQSLNSLEELDDTFIQGILKGNRFEVQGPDVRSWNFDAWRNLLTSAELFSGSQDAISISAHPFIVEWLLYAYSHNPKVIKGEINTGVFQYLPFCGYDNIVGEALLRRANSITLDTTWNPFEVGTEAIETRGQNTITKDLVFNSNSKLPYLIAIRTKPFLLLAGISGTGKSRIVRKLAQATDDIDTFANDTERFSCHSPTNFCLIQVKPNWHNSMDVVGFKSNIGKDGEHYEYTTFIEFIGKAWQNLNTPFFLCLDEMNLAPVEEYFAEFLSAIESRSIDANGNYETDPIIKPFKDFGKKVAFEMIEHLIGEKGDNIDNMSDLAKRLYYKGLTLPKNLIVMGTVNMDETTFSFSRKVLDRAMSIEMNEVDYDAFLEGTTDDDIPVLTDRNNLLINRPINALEIKNNINSDTIAKYLKSINTILEGTPLKLGYRAANEAMLYVAAAKDFGKEDIADALDDFTLMKILSRIEGDSSKLKTSNGECILEALSNFFKSEDGILYELEKSKTLAKLKGMKLILERDHFVSFWN